MGFLTTVTLHNDHWHSFETDPASFGHDIFELYDDANRSRRAQNRGGITVEPSRHADDHTVFVHYGNTVFNLGPWNEDFIRLLDRPDTLEGFVTTAEAIVKEARAKLNAAKKAAKLAKKKST